MNMGKDQTQNVVWGTSISYGSCTYVFIQGSGRYLIPLHLSIGETIELPLTSVGHLSQAEAAHVHVLGFN